MKKSVFLSFMLGSALLAAPIFAGGLFPLATPGPQEPVDYEKYGSFQGVGTPSYLYTVTDRAGLAAAAGEGIYPNRSHFEDPLFSTRASSRDKVEGWDFISVEPQEDFYAWCLTAEHDEGVKLYHIAEALRRAGHFRQALKAYHALIVHFPRTVIWAPNRSFYWYPAPEAIGRARKVCAEHPELGVQLEGAFVDIERSKEGRPEFDRVAVSPGRFVRSAPVRTPRSDFKITAERGKGKVRLVQYNDKFWEILKDEKPFFVKGVTYTSTTVGESAHALNLRSWLKLDDNKNGRNDGMFDSWVDANGNGRRDEDEPIVGDAELLRRMGANAIRHYHGVDSWGNYDPAEYDKPLMRMLADDYGIFFIMGDFLGAYTLGSQANWDAGTDYTDPEQRTRMLKVLKDMVMDHKDESYVLMWLLGNENQHPHTHTNAFEFPEAYALFLNEAAEMIHDLDPDHPVAVCNLNFQGLKELALFTPEIDIYGANVYAGAYSMGSVWHLVRERYDRPVMITEMGCDVWAEGKGLDEDGQADYFAQNWRDIRLNSAGERGEGNAIGGIFFEWMDEWWKSSKGDAWGDPQDHNTQSDFAGPFPDGHLHEEWLGIFGQGKGNDSPYLREPRKVYEEIRRTWTEE